jgi:hypothetical protein
VGFNSTWIRKPYAGEGVAYGNTLVGSATGDSPIYSKGSGPDWLID